MVARFILPAALLALAACGGGITTRQVYDRLERAGLATNARMVQPAETDSPIGQCGERLEFDIPDAGTGTIIVCPTGTRIDAFGGGALYRSAGGSVNVLVSGASATAPRIGDLVQQIKE